MLPDRLVLIEQKLVENAKIEKFKCNLLINFQTTWIELIIDFLLIFGAKIQDIEL